MWMIVLKTNFKLREYNENYVLCKNILPNPILI